MGRKSNAMSIMQADFVPGANEDELSTRLNEHTLTNELRDVVAEIDQIFGDVQVASLTAFWRVGKLITDVKNNPETYLTDEQQAAQIDGASLVISIFAPVYTADQLRGAVNFYERYPAEQEITRLLALRCPDRPRWRMTVSHVQLLSQVSDEDQRAVLEDKCAEEALTARNLSLELQEIRGKKKNSGRTHQAPKGLKQQLLDLLNHQRRFIARSEKLWLSENTDNIYDDVANASPEKLDEIIVGLFAEMRQNFETMSDMVADHVAMCRKVHEEVISRLGSEDEDDAFEDEQETSTPKRKSDITR
jgi:hypothetical protein